jgi:hypothetical protein
MTELEFTHRDPAGETDHLNPDGKRKRRKVNKIQQEENLDERIQEETNEEGNVASLPSIGTELWGRPKPSTKVPGAKWIKTGFGEDPYHPQWHTGWKLVANERSRKKVETTPPEFNENEFAAESPPKIIRRSQKEIGNYNADLTSKDD